jgi:hypothetical protein
MKVIVSPSNHLHHHHNDLNEGSPSGSRRRNNNNKDDSLVYLDKLKDYPSCQPVYDEGSDVYSFDLPLDDDSFFMCGTSRLKNKITGTKVFYHKVVIEQKILRGQDEGGRRRVRRSAATAASASTYSPSSSSSSSHPSDAASGTTSSSSSSTNDAASSSSSSSPLPVASDSATATAASASADASRLLPPDSHVKHLDQQLHNRVRDRSSSALHAASTDPHHSAASSDAAAAAGGHADGSGDEDHENDDLISSAPVPEEGSNEDEDDSWTQETVTIRCIVPGDTSVAAFNHPRARRQVTITEPELPANFSESSEELIDFSGSVTGRAPMPLLNIAVKQNGEFVDTALNVSPGTPLEMVIYLDDVSSRVYGLLTTFLRVTDNTPRKQEEIIILNGCSIDPYIFANFETQDEGKSLSAKFRAFKFPESNYVLFVGTVNVCLKSCLGVQCGEGQVGYGRRKRSYDPLPFDPNKVFEAELTAFIRVGDSERHKSSLSSQAHDPAILSPSHPLKWTSTPSDGSAAVASRRSDNSGSSRSGSSKNAPIIAKTDLFLSFISISAAVLVIINSLTSDRRWSL